MSTAERRWPLSALCSPHESTVLALRLALLLATSRAGSALAGSAPLVAETRAREKTRKINALRMQMRFGRSAPEASVLGAVAELWPLECRHSGGAAPGCAKVNAIVGLPGVARSPSAQRDHALRRHSVIARRR